MDCGNDGKGRSKSTMSTTYCSTDYIVTSCPSQARLASVGRCQSSFAVCLPLPPGSNRENLQFGIRPHRGGKLSLSLSKPDEPAKLTKTLGYSYKSGGARKLRHLGGICSLNVGLHFTVILNQGSSRIPLTLLPFTPTRPATFLRRKTSKCQATRKAGIIKFPKEKSPARTYEVWTDQPGLGRRNAKLKALPKGWAQDRQAFRFFFFFASTELP